MKSARELDYWLHHACIYDDKPRESIWPYLKWHHGITNFFTGDVFHVTGEGHSDYTFMGCGGNFFQVQLEAPPFQFEYERQWYDRHGNGMNHVCWVVNDARASHDQLLADGAELVMEFEKFPTYDGFVVKDPEGRWVEIMEYTDKNFRVQQFTNAPSGECGLQMIGCSEVVSNLDKMVAWYETALDMHIIESYEKDGNHSVYLGDRFYDPETHNSILVLKNAATDYEKHCLEKHGPHISSLIYQAENIERAHEDALWAGLEEISPIANDPITGARIAQFREPVGNGITLREKFAPSKFSAPGK
jgi:catechol 2,3-dioxygenase-like lactoylglutathione lyase family enzyme